LVVVSGILEHFDSSASRRAQSSDLSAACRRAPAPNCPPRALHAARASTRILARGALSLREPSGATRAPAAIARAQQPGDRARGAWRALTAAVLLPLL
jgi:hypothetical protein